MRRKQPSKQDQEGQDHTISPVGEQRDHLTSRGGERLAQEEAKEGQEYLTSPVGERQAQEGGKEGQDHIISPVGEQQAQ